jgi:hypothetical protein
VAAKHFMLVSVIVATKKVHVDNCKTDKCQDKDPTVKAIGLHWELLWVLQGKESPASPFLLRCSSSLTKRKTFLRQTSGFRFDAALQQTKMFKFWSAEAAPAQCMFAFVVEEAFQGMLQTLMRCIESKRKQQKWRFISRGQSKARAQLTRVQQTCVAVNAA